MAASKRGLASTLFLVAVIAVAWGFGVLQTDSTEPVSVPGAEEWTVVVVYDGDTFLASRGGVEEKIRLIGIDTPEIGECGYREASEALQDRIGGRRVLLVPGADTDRDRYGRLLRYVEVDGEDVGLWLLESGLAVEVFDRRTGQPHDREDAYIEADRASADLCPAGN